MPSFEILPSYRRVSWLRFAHLEPQPADYAIMWRQAVSWKISSRSEAHRCGQ